MRNYNYKRIQLLFIVVITVFLMNAEVKAKEVDFEIVKKVAINAFTLNSGKTNLKIIEIIPISENDKVVYYIFNFEKGHIVVANDDIIIPVLGYGLKSNINLNKIPPGLLSLLNNYKNEILFAQKQKLQSNKEINDKWDYYLNLDEQTALKSYSPGTYLLETTWGQQSGYQQYCPNDPETGYQSVVGCGGVALGQILKYWSCRVFPDGSITYTPSGFSSSITVNFYNQDYQWQNMNLTSSDNDNALLLYHSAVALRSDFGSDGTSSLPFQARNALRTYFGFNANFENKNNYSNSTWVNMLKNDLDAGRPIFYAGFNDNSGHAWVVDGYKTNNTFHCNWGWNGSYDTWYYLSDLTPGSHNYNDDQIAVLNVYPILDACLGLSGSRLICNSNSSYSVSIPSSASVIWSKSNNLIQIGGNSGITYTVRATNSSQSGSGYVKATIKNSQGQVFLTRNKNVWVGRPGQPIANPTGYPTVQMALGQIKPINVTSAPGYPNQYIWEITGSIEKIVDNDASVVVEATELGWGNFRVKTRNQCGYSAIGGGAVKVSSGGGGGMMMLSISPNPSSSEITISISSKYEKDMFDENEQWNIEIYNLYYVLQIKRHVKGSTVNINTNAWKEGIYMIKATYKGEVLSGRLLIKR